MERATAAQKDGDLEQAESDYRALTTRFPRFPDAWHYYGILRHQRGDHERALELLRRADRLEPNNVVFLANLASVLREQRRLLDSLAVLDRAYALAPYHAQVFTQRIRTYLLAHCGGDLIGEVEQRIAREPPNWHLWQLLGECLEQGGERQRALEAFQRAVDLAPADDTDALVRLGSAAHHMGDLDIAISAFRNAVRRHSDRAPAFLGLATCASERGRFRRASAIAGYALRLDPNSHGAWRLILRQTDSQHADQLLEEMEEAARCADGGRQEWLLHFARGDAWEKRGDYDQAFSAYAYGNALRSPDRPYSRVDQIAWAEDVRRHLDAEFVARAEAVGVDEPAAIFVCGMPRSGTTLVESILAAHPDVAAGGEMRHIHDELRRRLRGDARGRPGTWLAAATNSELRILAEGWRTALRRIANGRPRMTDKMPGNFSLLGLIHVCLTGARIVHVRRDPRDTCFSCFATPFAEGNEFSFRLADLGHYYRLYERFMDHWRQVLGPEKIIEISYEQLVEDPESEVRRLLAALELAWDPCCLDFHKSRRRVATASVFQVRQPMYATSIGRWHRFEDHLSPLLAALGDETSA